MSSCPLVSVVIPVYNGSNYLEQAVDSVLKQSYGNCEIVIVNDGSTDSGKTRSVALSYKDKVKYIEKENGGVASALNCGIRVMRGEYFAWLSHDDIFLPNKIEKQVRAILDTECQVTIAQGNYMFSSQSNGLNTATAFHKFYDNERICNSLFLFFWLETHFSNLLFHKSHFERVGLFNENLITAQDNEFMFRLLRGQKTVFTEDLVSLVRLHSESGTTQNFNLVNEENSKLYLHMAEQMAKHEIEEIFGNESVFYCKIASIIKSMNGKHQLSIIEKKLSNGIQEQDREKQHANRKLMDKYQTPLIIFGAGQYGIRLKYELNARNIFPKCFIDNNPNKNGCVIDGIQCHLVEYAKEHPDNYIIIAQKSYSDAYEQLKNIGIERIILKEEIDAKLLIVQPSILPIV